MRTQDALELAIGALADAQTRSNHAETEAAIEVLRSLQERSVQVVVFDLDGDVGVAAVVGGFPCTLQRFEYSEELDEGKDVDCQIRNLDDLRAWAEDEWETDVVLELPIVEPDR